jgi:hypothetical protein
MEWFGLLLPHQRAKLGRSAQDKEHSMSQTLNTSIAVVGIDIGKNEVVVIIRRYMLKQ